MNQLQKELELNKPGIWECWRLEDSSIIIVDRMKLLHDFPFYEAYGYKGKKVIEKLGFATTLYQAYCMFQTYYNWDGITKVPMLSNGKVDVDKILQDMNKICDQNIHQNSN